MVPHPKKAISLHYDTPTSVERVNLSLSPLSLPPFFPAWIISCCCACQMSYSPSSSRSLVKRGQNGHPDKPAERASTAGNPTIGGGGGYALPEYRHGAPWPRPRPTAAVAERARRRRRAREERGASTPADAHAELEEKVSACLFGVLPEEYCRDAPPQTAKEEGGGVSGGGLPLATGKAAKASIRTRCEARPVTVIPGTRLLRIGRRK